MEIFLIRLLQFMLAISILVLLHEGGHFFFSKLFGVRVEKFYLFFDPWFHLFEFKPKKSDTTYGVGWLPLGGYCKISGMIDESFDTEQMKQPAQPWEFRSKPAWQRLLIMIGGVLVNFLLALFIYSMVLFYWGDSYMPVQNMTMGMKFNTEAKAIGFQDGDVPVGTDQKEFKKFDVDLPAGSPLALVVHRQGDMNYQWTVDKGTGLIKSVEVTYQSRQYGKTTVDCTYDGFKVLNGRQFPTVISLSMQTEALKRAKKMTLKLSLSSFDTSSDWDVKTTVGSKYKKVDAQDLMNKLLSM